MTTRVASQKKAICAVMLLAMLFTMLFVPTQRAEAAGYSTGSYTVAHNMGVNVRKTPPSGAILGAAAKGVKFTVTKVSGDYGYTSSIKTTKGNKAGWVHLGYCTYTEKTNNSQSGNVRTAITNIAKNQVGKYGTTYQKWAKLSTSQAWCVAYATWVANQANNQTIKKSGILPSGGSAASRGTLSLAAFYMNNSSRGKYYCFKSWKGTSISAKKNKNTKDYNPKIGDFITVENNGNANDGPDHVGIVTKVSSDTLTVSEGNVNIGKSKNGVAQKTYKIKKRSDGCYYWQRTDWSKAYIVGIASPNY